MAREPKHGRVHPRDVKAGVETWAKRNGTEDEAGRNWRRGATKFHAVVPAHFFNAADQFKHHKRYSQGDAPT